MGSFPLRLPTGDYQVKELETAPGYVTMKESIAVELDKTDVDLGGHRKLPNRGTFL